MEEWRGLPFNSPNDVVVASDGAIWFTDPSYGHLQDLFRRIKADFDPTRGDVRESWDQVQAAVAA